MHHMKTRYDYAPALDIADQIKVSLKPFCARIEIAGSLRRKKETVGDIEMLFIPLSEDRQADMFSTEPIDLAHEELNRRLATGILEKREGQNGTFAWGPKNKLAIHVATGIPIDFFSTSLENWNVSYVIRTGGKETNLALTNGAIYKGRSLSAYGSGVTVKATGEKIDAKSERHVFELCGVKYREPEDRE